MRRRIAFILAALALSPPASSAPSEAKDVPTDADALKARRIHTQRGLAQAARCPASRLRPLRPPADETGVDEATLGTLTVENPRRWLTVADGGTAG